MVIQILRGSGDRFNSLLADDTDILIDGFPRSANSWTVRVFRFWQRMDRVRVAHHQHSEAHIVAATTRGVPVLVLVRDPADAIRSWCLHDSSIESAWALSRWLRFYEAVERIADRAVIATFEQATGDPGAVFARVNARFGTRFRHFPMTPALRERVLGAMNPRSRPHAGRDELLERAAPVLDPAKLAEARELFKRLAAHASTTSCT
ncbi:hypothetical protein [Aurantiacibacter sp. MUD61]|uniref:hypothetical protein n=1 Tax=Aurantiacibacter sp. MUD61 TaxID=3009083 RepID=UPI0022EFDF0C|nr:hypothetical protein [Aurantiacibacter sp. MUD61]